MSRIPDAGSRLSAPAPDTRSTVPVSVPDQSRQLQVEVRRTTEAFRALAGPLTSAQLAWTPPGGGWSVGQVLEHLVVSNALYLPLCESLVARGSPVGGAPVMWAPSLMGGFLARAVSPDTIRRLPTPRVMKPGPAARDGVLDAFIGVQDRIAALIERAAPLDWRRLRGASPVTPLIRLNLGDAFVILANHSARHLGQARRVIALESFPR